MFTMVKDSSPVAAKMSLVGSDHYFVHTHAHTHAHTHTHHTHTVATHYMDRHGWYCDIVRISLH